MSFDKILTLQQILDSENNFIINNSEKILIDNAGKKVGEFLRITKIKGFALFVVQEIMEKMEK